MNFLLNSVCCFFHFHFIEGSLTLPSQLHYSLYCSLLHSAVIISSDSYLFRGVCMTWAWSVTIVFFIFVRASSSQSRSSDIPGAAWLNLDFWSLSIASIQCHVCAPLLVQNPQRFELNVTVSLISSQSTLFYIAMMSKPFIKPGTVRIPYLSSLHTWNICWIWIP